MWILIISPILIWVYPQKWCRLDLTHFGSNLSNSHSPSCSIHDILFHQTNTLVLLLHLLLPRLLWSSSLPLALCFKLQQLFSHAHHSSSTHVCTISLHSPLPSEPLFPSIPTPPLGPIAVLFFSISAHFLNSSLFPVCCLIGTLYCQYLLSLSTTCPHAWKKHVLLANQNSELWQSNFKVYSLTFECLVPFCKHFTRSKDSNMYRHFVFWSFENQNKWYEINEVFVVWYQPWSFTINIGIKKVNAHVNNVWAVSNFKDSLIVKTFKS